MFRLPCMQAGGTGLLSLQSFQYIRTANFRGDGHFRHRYAATEL
jgi:hypothetical protein